MRANRGVSGLSVLGLLVALLGSTTVRAGEPLSGSGEVFRHKERSTVDSIRFQALPAEDLSEAAIEGALGPTAAGSASMPVSEEVARLRTETPNFETQDAQTDLGRHEIPIDFRFEPPKSVPGVQFSDQYVIRPDSNRTYEAFNTATTAR